MTDALVWLAQRIEGAPDQLRARMEAAVTSVTTEAAVHERLALAGQACLTRALHDSSYDSALELLAADALFTHASEAAAEAGSDVLATFARTWSAERFEQLLVHLA